MKMLAKHGRKCQNEREAKARQRKCLPNHSEPVKEVRHHG